LKGISWLKKKDRPKWSKEYLETQLVKLHSAKKTHYYINPADYIDMMNENSKY